MSSLRVGCILRVYRIHVHNGPIAMPDFPDAANGMLTMFNQIMMFKNIGLAGGFLVLAGAGAGALSIDARRGA